MGYDPTDRDDGPTFDNSHVSGHWHDSGGEDHHACSQEGHYGDSDFISYTDVDSEGNVGDSGFDDKS